MHVKWNMSNVDNRFYTEKNHCIKIEANKCMMNPFGIQYLSGLAGEYKTSSKKTHTFTKFDSDVSQRLFGDLKRENTDGTYTLKELTVRKI